jgi:ATP-dependent Clp protease ATP-binding subunit ClpC
MAACTQVSFMPERFFDRYSISARRAIFYARQEAGDMGTSSIEAEHLLLGVLRENKELLGSGVADEICFELRGNANPPRSPFDDPLAYSADMPVSRECKRALEVAAEEAARRKDEVIVPAHLMLGLLHDLTSQAALTLGKKGFDAATFRNHMVPPIASGFEGTNYV